MDAPFTVRSGSVKRDGRNALFATLGAISEGVLNPKLLDEGSAPTRSVASAEVYPGNVLVALRGSFNTAAVVDRTFGKPLFATLDLAVIHPGEALDPAYLAWFVNLASTQAALAAKRVGGGVARLPLPALEALPLRAPPLDIQRRIAEAAALGRADQRLTERLSKLRRDYLAAALETAVDLHQSAKETRCTP